VSVAPGPVADLVVVPGPLLLRDAWLGADLRSHRAVRGPAPHLPVDALVELVTDAGLRGRGGAGFPFGRKLAVTAGGRRRPVVVVNAAEGEPESAKDTALLRTVPHLVLDGAATVADALGARDVRVVTASDRPETGDSIGAALRERDDPRLRWRHHETAGRFVAGQSSAVVELLSGREGLPVSTWRPLAERGLGGRPTLLSNAETFAHVAVLAHEGLAAYASVGVADEPGTRLLTVTSRFGRHLRRSFREPEARVLEVAHGTPFSRALGPAEVAGPVLLGGFHGTWVDGRDLAALRVSTSDLVGHGLTTGAGVVLPLGGLGCPVRATAEVAAFLAGESAGRCGPCIHGLPALADALARLADGVDTRPRVVELAGVVTGRGACAHPDGTARLATSLLDRLDAHVEQHLAGHCACALSRRAAS
jgi:NADH:ubiquinone oxidoreductase subunit F (NADH-binding)